MYSKLVRDLEVERRNCIFADERDVPGASITVFTLYSQVRGEGYYYNLSLSNHNIIMLGELFPGVPRQDPAEEVWLSALLLPQASDC